MRSPVVVESRVSTFQMRFPESDPWEKPFRVSWYEPNTRPGKLPAFRWHGSPIALAKDGRPVAHESIWFAAPIIELELSWLSLIGPLAERIPSRVVGFRTPKRATQRFGVVPEKNVEKSDAMTSGNVILSVALRKRSLLPRSTMYSWPEGRFW